MCGAGDRQSGVRAWWSGLRRLARERHSGVVLTVAIALPALLGATGLAVDLGQWYRERATLQTATDAAALGAARLLTDSSASQDDYVTVALAEAEGAIAAGTVGQLITPITVHVVAGTSVTVTLQSTANQYFTSGLLVSRPTLTATAEAGPAPPPTCVLALSKTASPGISISGNVNVSASHCSVFSDSTSADALNISGNATIVAKEIGSAGITQTSGAVSVTPAPQNNQKAELDPYANLTPPTPGTCFAGPSSYSGGTITLNPGTYCSGLNFSGTATVTFNPGTYILEGNFVLSGGVTIASADGVTFYLGGGVSTATVNWSGGTVTQSPMTAPLTGPYAGVLIYQDRSASLGNAASISGNASFQIGGAVYMPRAALTMSGTSSATPPAATGLSAFANTVSISGDQHFATGTASGVGISAEVVLLQ